MSLFANLPQELRSLKQWCLWRYEDVGAAKPTKVPYSVNGKHASVTDTSTWSTFQDVVTRFNAGGYSGIGFIFSDDDPYSFIDLDDAEGDDAILQRQLKVYHEFNSYSEVSPSGKGLHIIVKGVISAGRRRSNIEVYSSQRYATMTGNIYNNQNIIQDRQELLKQLWEQIGSGPVAQSIYHGDDKEKQSDEEIINMAIAAVNGDKFAKLNSGNWQELYSSQSEADFAYIDIIAFYTQNKAQITRIFRKSPLGQRDKAKRNDYVNSMITRSFDRMLPPLDFDGIKNALELKLARQNGIQEQGRSISSAASSLQEQSKLLFETQQRSSQQNFRMDGSIEGDLGLQSMSGKSSSLSRIPSYGPNNERNDYISSHSQRRMVDGEDTERNKQVHNPVRQLSQKTSFQGTLDLGAVAQRSEPFAHNGLVVGSNPTSPTTNLPPGLVGEIAQFIYQAAPRPVPEVALAASIALMAGITGRAYNISGTGLNQYVLLLAMTGAGKEAAASGINKLMSMIKMQVPTSYGFIGPSEISSGSALFKYLGNQSQSFISLLGEFGLRLQQMSSQNANSSEVSLRRMFLDLYNKSGFTEILHASVYSDKANNTSAVSSPSFSILGESTPERFYGALNEDMISEGLLPRFLLIEYKGNRPALNENHTSVVPSFSLIEKLAALAAQCETVNHSNPRRVINVGSTFEASKMLSDFDKYADNRINNTNKDTIRQLWNRAHIKVLKLSALIAVGQNMIEPTIQASDMKWAADLVQADIAALTERFEAGEIGHNTFEIKQAGEIIRVIKDYYKLPYESVSKYMQPANPVLHQDRVVPYVYIQRRLIAAAAFRNDKSGATFAMKRAIQNLVDADRIKELGKVWAQEKYGTSQRCFALSDLGILD